MGLDDPVCVKLMEMMVAEIGMHTREKYTWSLVPERPPSVLGVMMMLANMFVQNSS